MDTQPVDPLRTRGRGPIPRKDLTAKGMGMISRETWRTHRAIAASLGLAMACGSNRSPSLDPAGPNATGDDETDGGASSGGMTFGSDGGGAEFAVTIESGSKGALTTLTSSCAGACEDVTATARGGVPP